jgi:amino-acid N-acetyltransferase
VVEHDGMIVGCAALYPYGDEQSMQAELACMAVHSNYRRWGYGEQLLKHIETRARAAGIKRLFVLTTVTGHWFKERGFAERPISELPAEKRQLYNLQRRSKVLMKPL